MSKALFLDRDGTLIIDKDYLADPSGVELLPGIAGALTTARALGYKIFLFTNQSGIGRGFYTLEDAKRVNARMEELLALPPPVFDEICIAPEAPEQPSAYRKPSPRFIIECIARHSLNAKDCWMVGDRESDVQAGLRANIRAAAVCTGKHSAEEWAPLVPKGVSIYPSLVDLVAALT